MAPRAGAALPAQNAGGARSGETPRAPRGGKWGLASRVTAGKWRPRGVPAVQPGPGHREPGTRSLWVLPRGLALS